MLLQLHSTLRRYCTTLLHESGIQPPPLALPKSPLHFFGNTSSTSIFTSKVSPASISPTRLVP
jgi:hypothetical protein